VVHLLQDSGIAPTGSELKGLERYVELVREWNAVCGLVSTGDVDELWINHVADSLSLAPVIGAIVSQDGVWLDIGSGGGFPGLPVKLVLSSVRLVLVERSIKKVGFLRKACAALGLRDVEILAGEYPRVGGDVAAAVVTARAVDKPEKVVKTVLAGMEVGSVFLCQSGEPRVVAPSMFHVEPSGKRFHVEPICDAWSTAHLRRGELWSVRRLS
jgi:16S rRNA (guanine527-N7)-methyltransferase